MDRVARWLADIFFVLLGVATLAGLFWLCSCSISEMDKENIKVKQEQERLVQSCQDKGGFIVHQYKSDDLCISEQDGHIIKYK